jgi:hypothetical protein
VQRNRRVIGLQCSFSADNVPTIATSVDNPQLSYEFYLGTYGNESVRAPELRIQTRSPGTGRYSDFIWSPYNGNQDNQGPLVDDAWNQDFISETSGSNASWPTGSTGGSGWSCTLGCYFSLDSPANGTDSGNLTHPASVSAATFRNLQTYVSALLDTTTCSEPNCAINDAIITGIQVVLTAPGAGSAWTAYTQDVRVAAGGYDWSWTFGCGAAERRHRRQQHQLQPRARERVSSRV